MQKYRKWTDQATGVNPYVQVKQRPFLIILIPMFIVAALKFLIFIIFLLPLLIIIMIASKLLLLTAIKRFVVETTFKIFLIYCNLFQKDEYNYRALVQTKLNHKPTLFLSNHCTILDTFYYLSTISPLNIIVTYFHPHDNSYTYELLSPMKALFSLLLKRQPYFKVCTSQQKKGQSFEIVIQKSLSSNKNTLLFYEGIRTNGMGTIKPSRQLLEKIYKLQKNVVFCHLKYTVSPSKNNLMTMICFHPLRLMFNVFTLFRITLRARSKFIRIQQINTVTQFQTQLSQFITLNSSKLLQTMPQSYFDFLEYYNKNS